MNTSPLHPLIAFASGKGGVGKTLLAITYAHALAEQGKKVLLFDGDFGLANIDIQLGLTPPHDLSDLMTGKKALNQIVFPNRFRFDYRPFRTSKFNQPAC